MKSRVTFESRTWSIADDMAIVIDSMDALEEAQRSVNDASSVVGVSIDRKEISSLQIARLVPSVAHPDLPIESE